MRPPLQIPLNLGTFFQPNLAFGRRRTDGLRLCLCLCQASRPPGPAIWSLCHGDKLNLPGFEMSQASRAVPTSGYLPPPLTRRISGSRLVPALLRQTPWWPCPANGGAGAGEGEGEGKAFPSRPSREGCSQVSAPCYSLQTGTAQYSTLRLTSALKSPPGCEPSLRAQTPVRSTPRRQQCVM